MSSTNAHIQELEALKNMLSSGKYNSLMNERVKKAAMDLIITMKSEEFVKNAFFSGKYENYTSDGLWSLATVKVGKETIEELTLTRGKNE